MIETRLDGTIFYITLNRPEKHNAFDAEMIQRLTQAVQSVPAGARVVVFTGNGKSFCAGADINYMRAQAQFSEDQNREDAKKLTQMFEAIYELTMPTVAYAQGNIFGGGLGVIASCDIVLAAADAKFCFSEVKLGIIPAVISPFVLKKTGATFARRYFLSAEIFSSTTALAAGLISEQVSIADSESALKAVVESLLQAGRDAQKSVKRLLMAHENLEAFSRDQLIHELAKLRSSEDAQLRMKNFLASRSK